MRCGYGTYIPPAASVASELREEIALAEQSGFDAIFFSEHHGVAGYPSDPLSLAVYALARTTTMRAGTMPLLLPLRDPVLVAETAGLADHLSGGRLVLGVGAGYLEKDFDQVGVPIAERGARFTEGIALMRQVWHGPVDHAGRFYRAKQTAPLLLGGEKDPTLWIASSSPIGARRAARWADGIMLNSMLSGADVKAAADRYREACGARGVAPGTVAAIRRGWFGDADEVEAFLRTFLAQVEGAVNFAEYSKYQWVRDRASRSFVQDVTFAGEPETVAEALASWCAKVGVDYVMFKVHWGSGGSDLVSEQLRRSAAFVRRLVG